MFDTYAEIFGRRGHSYHEAMLRFPSARQQEFDEFVTLADVVDTDIVCDAPSGGAYLSWYMGKCQAYIIPVDTTEQFVTHYRENPKVNGLRCELTALALRNDCIDKLLSLAGLHHLPDRPKFFGEAFRVLKPGGAICVADVAAGSKVAGWLNGFVDRHNSMGHQGDFLTPDTTYELSACGFAVTHHYRKSYHWLFADQNAMVECCRLMFGLDRATDQEILAGIADCLGYLNGKIGCMMNWELLFLRGEKR